MKSFSQLGIQSKNLTGDKIDIQNILNKEITVTDFRLNDSKYNRDICMTMQFILESETFVVFTGSNVLISDIGLIPKDSFPFKTTIIKTQIDQKKFFLKFT